MVTAGVKAQHDTVPGDRMPGDRMPGDRMPGDRMPGDRMPEAVPGAAQAGVSGDRIRVGVDLAAVTVVANSLARFGDRYARRVFTATELSDCEGPGPARARGLAARFAAKEAVLKALRVSDEVPPWTDIEVVRQPGGWPELQLHGDAARLANLQGLVTWTVSLSHETDVAAAVVVASGPMVPDR
jgi:holo-[acyl-carrier protein] synthase